jgi:hypothetical protein
VSPQAARPAAASAQAASRAIVVFMSGTSPGSDKRQPLDTAKSFQ